MSDLIHNTTVNAAIIPEVWSARFYAVLRSKLPFLLPGVIDRSYEGAISSLGDIVNITTIADFDEATELAEGARGDADVTSMTGQQLTINKNTYKDFIVTKTAQLQSLPHMDSLREKAIFAINKRMQQVIIDNISPSASAPDHVIAYDSSSTLALADILEAKELLDTANVEEMNRQAVMGAAQWNDMFNITGFTSRDFIPAGSPLTSGTFNTPILGFTPRLTTVVGNTSYWFHPEFMTLAVQDQLSVEVHKLGADGKRGTRVNADILWGLKQLGNTRIVSLA